MVQIPVNQTNDEAYITDMKNDHVARNTTIFKHTKPETGIFRKIDQQSSSSLNPLNPLNPTNPLKGGSASIHQSNRHSARQKKNDVCVDLSAMSAADTIASDTNTFFKKFGKLNNAMTETSKSNLDVTNTLSCDNCEKHSTNLGTGTGATETMIKLFNLPNQHNSTCSSLNGGDDTLSQSDFFKKTDDGNVRSDNFDLKQDLDNLNMLQNALDQTSVLDWNNNNSNESLDRNDDLTDGRKDDRTDDTIISHSQPIKVMGKNIYKPRKIEINTSEDIAVK
jgi:hypothetical protein